MEKEKRRLNRFIEVEGEPLYIQLYYYYKKLIEEGHLKVNSKLPSVRRCALEHHISKTTVETAYLQLAAEGYIEARAGSGFYVNEILYLKRQEEKVEHQKERENNKEIIYNFASSTVDDKSFNFDLWRRYIKSALRNTERLLSYGEAQGEYDLRTVLAQYVREKRGVICNPEQIVIGAGMQTLLHILCTLIPQKSKVLLTGSEFKQGRALFEDRGFRVKNYGKLAGDLIGFEEEQPDIIYTSPSHITLGGEVMPMQTRLALLGYAQEHTALIIEDDYDSEFSYYSRPIPSLQGMDGGRNVVYMSTFSKLLLPSIRMSFMVLPLSMLEKYQKKREEYNQTASKMEQIALCQFIRDGHLEKQIKKARRLYLMKRNLLGESIEKVFGNKVKVLTGVSGFWIQMEIETILEVNELEEQARQVGILLKVEEHEVRQLKRMFLSCSGVHESEFESAMNLLKEIVLE